MRSWSKYLISDGKVPKNRFETKKSSKTFFDKKIFALPIGNVKIFFDIPTQITQKNFVQKTRSRYDV